MKSKISNALFKKKSFFDELILKCIRKLKQNPRIATTAKITLKRKNGVGEF